ncbi:hypothetical protein UR09_02495 [Candidatus Nitromaritima sp. SCGC AAA799-A02]|nr:hypothetical protein UR09_02495 [Candidatus Nitromaritima sp. SCGC AAA799-A02]
MVTESEDSLKIISYLSAISMSKRLKNKEKQDFNPVFREKPEIRGRDGAVCSFSAVLILKNWDGGAEFSV